MKSWWELLKFALEGLKRGEFLLWTVSDDIALIHRIEKEVSEQIKIDGYWGCGEVWLIKTDNDPWAIQINVNELSDLVADKNNVLWGSGKTYREFIDLCVSGIKEVHKRN